MGTSILLYLLMGAAPLFVQNAAAPPANAGSPPATSSGAGSSSMTSILPDLDKLRAAASQAAIDIGHMRIEKWKADGDSKRQAQSNADSLQRNLTSALPGLIEAARSAPQDLGAEFKLYRNLNALYDVMGSLTESTGAFGPRADYEALAQQFQVIDLVRRDLGNALERLIVSIQSELTQLRSQVRTQGQAAAAAPAKKVVVDDTEPSPKTVHKKKKPATSGSGSSSPNEAGSSTPSTSGNVPKS